MTDQPTETPGRFTNEGYAPPVYDTLAEAVAASSLTAAPPPPPPPPPADTTEETNMPWTKEQGNSECNADEWAVVNEQTGDVMGCHATEEEADAQIAALNANVDETTDALETRAAEPATPTGPAVGDMAEDGDPWYGILAPEGITSGDGRRFAPESLTWRDLPLPLMYQEATAMFHDGAVRVGRIDGIERDGAMIRGWGVWDTSEVAQEAQRQVEAKMLRGVSIEADDYVADLVTEDGEPVDWEDLLFGPMDGDDAGQIIEEASAARICGATLVSVPAFHQSYVANGTRDPSLPEPGQDEDVEETGPPATVTEPAVTAAGWSLAAAALTALPHAMFENPRLDGPTALTVEPDGHIYGHLAVWGECHIGHDGVCVVPPHSSSGYLYFATGVIDTDRGAQPVGQITMATGHADPALRWRPAAAHYDNTGTAVADIAVGEDEHGIWYSGMIRPGTSEQQIRDLRAGGALSGDWRDTGGPDLELVAALAVNVPGFPIPRIQVSASGGRQNALVASGVVGPSVTAWRTGQIDRKALTREVVAVFDRRAKVARLRKRIGRDPASRVAAATRMIRGEQ